ncbi:phosphatase PAP2 family protein [Rothia sp. P13129]|uniref:phosphatase PAP2 family protein n=1 Tax=Rothia sp. P13129 TaxID=3402664 RepID=UPI003AC8092B
MVVLKYLDHTVDQQKGSSRTLMHREEQPRQPHHGDQITQVLPTTPVPQHSKEQSPALNTSALRELTPSNLRRTRPTFWAMVQHLFVFILLGSALIGFFYFFIKTRIGQRLDEISFTEFSYQLTDYQQPTERILNFIPTVAAISAVIGLFFVIIWKHRFVPSLIGLSIAICSYISAYLLKYHLITKPDYGIQEAVLNSAPSGHTTVAAAAGSALFLAAPKKLRPLVALISAILTTATGFSTIVNGWHRPADVITAVLLVSLWTVIGLAILRFVRSEELDMSNTQRSGLILIPLLNIAGFFLGFCSLALYAITIYSPFPGCALSAATCMILTVISFSTSWLVALLRPQNKVRSPYYTKVWTY